MKRLADVLDQKYPQFNTTPPQKNLTDALYQMCCENVEYLIVIQDDKFKGILTEHDIAQKLMFAHKPLEQLKVEELMNRTLPVVNGSDSVEYGMQQLKQYGTRYMIVYDQFNFMGILSETDLLKHAIDAGIPLQGALQRQAYQWTY